MRRLAVLGCLLLVGAPVSGHARTPAVEDMVPGLRVLWPPDLSVVPEDGILVLGRAAPGADVVRGCGFLCEEHAVADEHGRWMMTVDELPYEETFAFELWSGDDRVVHHVRHEVVDGVEQLPIPYIDGPDGEPVPELEVIDVRALPFELRYKDSWPPREWGVQVVATVRNNSPGPIRMLPFWQRSGYAVHIEQRGRRARQWQGSLDPFPEVLEPGATGYLLGELSEDDPLPEGLRLSVDLELAYAYIDPVPGLVATVTSTRLHPIEVGGWFATGGFSGDIAGPHYAVAVIGLDRQGHPTGFAIDDLTDDGGGTRSSPEAEAPPRYRVCCLQGRRPASLLGFAQRRFDDALPWWPEADPGGTGG